MPGIELSLDTLLQGKCCTHFNSKKNFIKHIESRLHVLNLIWRKTQEINLTHKRALLNKIGIGLFIIYTKEYHKFLISWAHNITFAELDSQRVTLAMLPPVRMFYIDSKKKMFLKSLFCFCF